MLSGRRTSAGTRGSSATSRLSARVPPTTSGRRPAGPCTASSVPEAGGPVLNVEGVDFVSIPTRDLERARRFYGETLGLQPSLYTPDEFETANVTLGLWLPEADGEPFEPTTAGIALRVAEVAAARR